MDLSTLNPQQKEAVLHREGPLLILAGAGSGKTRVLTHRVAQLIESGVRPWSILAITFTNKAAREMKERIESLAGQEAQEVWVSTFHACCVRILRRDIEKLGYSRSFSIYDSDDQLSLIKKIVKEENINDKQYPPRDLKAVISDAKNRLLTADEWEKEQGVSDIKTRTIHRVFSRYEKVLKESNALDFDDLIFKTLELFAINPPTLQYYQGKFDYILVDEYQDTNLAQFRLVSLLTGNKKNICVVGDDDQSIYAWRGADIRNILEFEDMFPGCKVIKLEQNYRSTSVILNAANSVISRNKGRKDKHLWTSLEGGEKIRLYRANDERDEAAFVCQTIRSLRDKQGSVEILKKDRELLCAVLRIVNDPSDDEAMKLILTKGEPHLNPEEAAQLVAFSGREQLPISMLLSRSDELNLSPDTADKLKETSDAVTDICIDLETGSLGGICDSVIQLSGIIPDTASRASGLESFRKAMQAAGDDISGIIAKLKAQLETKSTFDLKDTALLYRMNAQSRVLEEALTGSAIPYVVYGGLKFYERKEIKDLTAYMRLLLNPADDVALQRIINEPKRSIGDATVDALADWAAEHEMSMLVASGFAEEIGSLGARAKTALTKFNALMLELSELVDTMQPNELLKEIIERTGIREQYQKIQNEENEDRLRNIDELQTAVNEYVLNNPDGGLEGYLEQVALVTDQDMGDDSVQHVTLMTLHSAKGLEFDTVFMTGLEEGIFPSARSLYDAEKLEEERRLCYVGITRAKRRLYITYTRSRALYNERQTNMPSRFIDEIPSSLIENCNLAARQTSRLAPPSMPQNKPSFGKDITSLPNRKPLNITPASADSPAPEARFKVGDRISHHLYGSGRVLSVDIRNKRVSVRFDDGVEKVFPLSTQALTK